VLAATVASSIVQPLFGLASDRHSMPWLMPAGLLVAGAGLAVAGLVHPYGLTFAAITVSGLGVAAYHPEGAKYAAYASGGRRASAMSAYSVGGNFGYALGPLAAGALVASLGLRGGLLLVVPCAALAAALLLRYRFLESFTPERVPARAARPGEDRVGALVLLLTVIAFRSVAWFGLVTFVPLYEVSLGHTKAHGNHLLALLLLAGGVGTIFAGPVADRYGRRLVVLGSLVAAPILTAGYIVLGRALGAACLALVGVSVVGTFGVTMVMSQEYLPRRIGVASGLSAGLSIGIGGIGAVVLGAVADSVDLRTAMWVAAAVPVAALALGVLLPSSQRGPEVRLQPVSEP
jgi:FSR family fosmidomycin resistance protein-like MFS transporter